MPLRESAGGRASGARTRLYLEAERQRVLATCTACGRCVAVCPMLPFLAIKEHPPEAVAGGVLRVLRGEEDQAGALFAEACSGSARCRHVCPEGLDPYHVLRLAKLAIGKP